MATPPPAPPSPSAPAGGGKGGALREWSRGRGHVSALLRAAAGAGPRRSYLITLGTAPRYNSVRFASPPSSREGLQPSINLLLVFAHRNRGRTRWARRCCRCSPLFSRSLGVFLKRNMELLETGRAPHGVRFELKIVTISMDLKVLPEVPKPCSFCCKDGDDRHGSCFWEFPLSVPSRQGQW